MDEQEAARRYVEAGRMAAAEARKAGTPDYDHRAHDRAVEFERKAAEALAAAQAGGGDVGAGGR
ncbi:translation initiation factor 2 [Cellulomonas sp. ATA003]|uniref:translation initiation factor 2 n=1 Tax=Cellulomonas sp. ATA003 TaxID=3073064 RepID=UPI0028739BC1|nr:translation initiation factor 2 [Cellulomonas sp. ATA003]WNB87508.1 translation initiation factor 2 [Cellulomonas sp. ATA003]